MPATSFFKRRNKVKKETLFLFQVVMRSLNKDFYSIKCNLFIAVLEKNECYYLQRLYPEKCSDCSSFEFRKGEKKCLKKSR